VKSFILALTFFTRIPYPLRFEFDDRDFAKGLIYMPFIGLIIGVPLALYAYFVDLDNSFLTAFLLLLIYLGMTGGLHLDGLADYFDGMFSGRTRDRILEIMKDSHIGTFGVVGLCLYFLGMYSGLMSAEPLVLLLMPIMGRMVGLLLCAFGHYPKEAGMGQAMVDYGRWYHGVVWLIGFLLGLGLAGFPYVIAVMVNLALMGVFYLRSKEVIGGVTGDVIGAGIEMSQVLWLMTFAVMGGI